MRSIFLRLVRYLISKIEEIEYRHLDTIPADDLSDKIQDSYLFPETQLLIETDTGWEPLSALHKTRPYKHWKVKLSNGYLTECADHHLFYTEDYKQIRVSDLYAGDKIWTDQGLVEIESCYPTEHVAEMFDTTVMSVNHRYYGDGILSSNTVLCVEFTTKMTIKLQDGSIKTTCIGDFFYSELSKKRKLRFIEKIKWSMWKIYSKI